MCGGVAVTCAGFDLFRAHEKKIYFVATRLLSRGNEQIRSWSRDVWRVHDSIHVVATSYYGLETRYCVMGTRR